MLMLRILLAERLSRPALALGVVGLRSEPGGEEA